MSGPERPTTEAPQPSTFTAERQRVRQLQVVFSPQPVSVRVLLLGAGGVTIGREPDVEPALRLDDTTASKAHARVEASPDLATFSIIDLGSRNGIYVDGRRTERAELAPGSVIRVGRTLMVFVEAEVPADSRLEPETPALRGQSIAMQALRGEIALVAARPLPVLIRGDTGVGKERVAEEIHRQSGRSGRFVAVNCAAIPAELAESELFGHVPGAFTGATARNEGLFAAAEGGTLFLDEVGELSAALQAKLLRVLATLEVRPVGSSTVQRVDVRVLAATLRDLDRVVEGGRFRADLLARLASWTVVVPPLRARREDILRLAEAFLEREGTGAALSARAAEALLLYEWPKNVRELEQVVGAAAVRAQGAQLLKRSHLPPEIASLVQEEAAGGRAAATPPLELEVARDDVPTETELRLVLERCGGNIALVAKFFGKERPQIYRWAARHGIDVEAYRKG